jgi:acylphosphatase
MDYKKLLNYNFSLKENFNSSAKWPLLIAIITSAICLVLTYFILNIYGNYDIHATGNAKYDALVQERQHLKSDLKLVLKDNHTYLSDLESSPKSKSELASSLTNLLSESKLKLIKLNTNDSAPNTKDATLVIEAEGTYEQVKHFTQAVNAKVASSEVEVLKISKLKDKGLLHLTLALKFNNPPHLKASSIDLNYQAFNEAPHGGMFEGWHMIKAGFVQVDPANQPNVNDAITKKDPFQAPEIPSADTKNGADKKSENNKGSGFFLSGIMYSKKMSLCVITIPSGESKVFTAGDMVNPRLRIQAIDRDHIVLSSKVQGVSHTRSKKHRARQIEPKQENTFHINPDRQITFHLGEEILL